MKLVWIVLVAVLGVFISFQPISNARMGQVAGAPITGALTNFVVGFVLLMLVYSTGMLGHPRWSGLAQAPWWAWLGGAVGATFVATMIIAVPKIGALTAFAAIILGQLLGSTLIDNFGLFGMPVTSLSTSRAVGLALMGAGVFLTQR